VEKTILAKTELTTVKHTIAIMVSLGDRTHLTNYTYPRLAFWASQHGYSSMLLKKPFEDNLNRSPHFTKLMVHKIVPGFKRYIIVDDDLMFRKDAPVMESVPEGYVGLCKDGVQNNTDADHVKWTANSGFIVCDDSALVHLESAYHEGEYKYSCSYGSKKGIWGSFDQGILNDVLFKINKVYELDWRWNYQAVIEFYNNGMGWDKWRTNRFYRICYYLSLLSPVYNKNRSLLKKAYGIHMTMGVYPSFFSKIHK